MAERVVTVDIEAMLDGDAVLIAAVIRPYNPDGLPARWRGGSYVDAIVEAEGFADFGDLAANAHEYTGAMPSRLVEAGVGHTFLGWQRPVVAPPTPDLSRRRAVVTIDLGAAMGAGALVTQLDVLPVSASSRALEVLADGPGVNGSAWGSETFDALNDHPARLRTALENRGTNRRTTPAGPPGGWDDRRPSR